MDFIKQAARRYWIIYYLVYTGGVAYGIPSYWHRLSDEGGLLWLAAIYGASAGTALLAAIFLEVLGRMVLLIPAAIKHYKEQGREQGREEGRREERQRIEEEARLAAERRTEHVTTLEETLQAARETGWYEGREEGRREERRRIEDEVRLAVERRPEPSAIPEETLEAARAAGWQEGREAERQRIIAAFITQGERDANGALRVTLPPEVVKILFDESD